VAEDNRPPQFPERIAILALARGRPGSLLLLGRTPAPIDDAIAELLGDVALTAPDTPAGPEDLKGLGRFDAGLVTGLLGHLDLRPGREVIGLLRNLHCARLAVVLEPAALARGWTREDLLALEFLPAAPAGSPGGTEVFVYDIDLYNREREWNNARNWANPRNFSKFRW
jgi:hypothetical protein